MAPVEITYFTEIIEPEKRAAGLIGLALATCMVREDDSAPSFISPLLRNVGHVLCREWDVDQDSFCTDRRDGSTTLVLMGHRYVVPRATSQSAGLEIINAVVAPILNEIKALRDLPLQ